MKKDKEMLSYTDPQTQKSYFPSKKDSALQLNQVANNLLLITPSHVKNKDIYELESFLNDLYAQAHTQAWPTALQDALLEALGRASELSDTINRMPLTSFRSSNFFKTLKSFVPILKMIAVFLEE